MELYSDIFCDKPHDDPSRNHNIKNYSLYLSYMNKNEFSLVNRIRTTLVCIMKFYLDLSQ